MADTNPGASGANAQDRRGFSVLDGAALVLGAAVASVHMRDLVSAHDLTTFGWGLIWITFTGVALTAAGPFVFLMRRVVRRQADHPRTGDWLWALLGLPWCLAAGLHPPGPPVQPGPAAPDIALDTGTTLYVATLWTGLIASCLVALAIVWRSWVLAPPDQPPRHDQSPWTDLLGITLAVAWPLQVGFGLVVMG